MALAFEFVSKLTDAIGENHGLIFQFHSVDIVNYFKHLLDFLAQYSWHLEPVI